MGNYKGKMLMKRLKMAYLNSISKKVKSKSILLIMEMLEYLVFLKKKLRLKLHH